MCVYSWRDAPYIHFSCVMRHIKENMVNLDPKKLLELGGHFGHKVSRTNPKAKKYVYTAQSGISIIDLFKTVELGERAAKKLESAGVEGKTLLVIASKKVAKNIVAKQCEENTVPYLCEKWVGGFFSNFEEIHKNIQKANDWIEAQKTGGWDHMLKHERVKLEKELHKVLKVYKGVLKLDKIPDAVLIVDVKKEKNALNESMKVQERQRLQGIDQLMSFAILDTNVNPDVVQYPVMINDDTEQTIEYMFTYLLDAYINGRKKFQASEDKRIAAEEKKAEKVKKAQEIAEKKIHEKP